MPEVDEPTDLGKVIEEYRSEEAPVTIGMGVFERVINANTPQEGSAALRGFVHQLIESVPDPKQQDKTRLLVNNVVGPIFGPLWGQPVYQENLSYPQIVESARLQQQFVHLIYGASLPDAPLDLSETVYNMVSSFDRANVFPEGDTRNQEAWGQFGRWWNGVRAELAVANMFKRSNYPEDVVLPRYLTSAQVEAWDVRGKVDLAVVSNNMRTSLCIDAKSNFGMTKVVLPFFSEVPKSQLERLDPNLQQVLRGPTGDYRVMQGEIIIPTGRLSLLNNATSVEDKRDALDGYGNLQEADERAILTAIDKSLHR